MITPNRPSFRALFTVGTLVASLAIPLAGIAIADHNAYDDVCGDSTREDEAEDVDHFVWDVESDDGDVRDGSCDAFDSMWYLAVDGTDFGSGFSTFDPGAGTYVSNPETMDGLTVTRNIQVGTSAVGATTGWIRYIDSFANDTLLEIVTTVEIYGDLGSDGDEVPFVTATRGESLTPADRWHWSDDNDNGDDDPSLSFNWFGTGAVVTPVDVYDTSCEFDDCEEPGMVYELAVAPLTTVSIMTIGAQSVDNAAAAEKVCAFDAAPPIADADGGLLASVVNWDFDADPGACDASPPPPPPYECDEEPDGALDVEGFDWDVESDNGEVDDGSCDAFDGMWELAVDGSDFGAGFATFDPDAGTYISNPDEMSGLEVVRNIQAGTAAVDATQGWIRYVDSLHNPSEAPIEVTVRVYGNIGSDDDEDPFVSSSGDDVLDVTDRWHWSDDECDACDDPSLTFNWFGPGASVTPSDVDACESYDCNNPGVYYEIVVPAGETVSIMTIGAQSGSNGIAAEKATSFDASPPLVGLDGETIASIVNWDPSGPSCPVEDPTAGGPYEVDETSSVDVTAAPAASGEAVTEWDLDYDGESFDVDATGDSATFDASSIDGPASYTVAVRQRCDEELSATSTATVSVRNVAPNADAGPDQATNVGGPRQLNGSGSWDVIDPIIDYLWDFNYDGETFDVDASGVEVTYPAYAAGRFTIALRVADDDGGSGIDTMQMTVGGGGGGYAPPPAAPNNPPVADAGGPYSGPPGAEVLISGAGSSDPDGGDSLRYFWDLDGDGAFDDATGVETAFSSSGSGTFTVGLRVVDQKGAAGQDTADVTITGPGADRAERFAGPPGTSRVETAVAVSQGSYPSPSSAAVAVLARTDVFADALAGTAFAAGQDGPLLLTPPPSDSTSLHPVTRAELERVVVPGGAVYLLGGSNALASELEQEIRDLGFVVVRLAGATRIETAIAIADATSLSPNEIFLADGETFQSAMIAGPAAHRVGGVVLLTDGSASHPSVDDYLADHASALVTTVGRVAATAYPVSDASYSGLSDQDTSVQVAAAYFAGSATTGVARVDVFADALSGGVHSARNGGAILLTNGNFLSTVVRRHLENNAADLSTAYVYGGPGAITDEVRSEIQAAIS